MAEAKRSVEVERKFSVEPALVVPEVELRVSRTETHELAATYFDTPELTLLANKITMRRRSGGYDEGWHVKLPKTQSQRTEVHFPLTDTDQVPAEVRAVVADLVGDHPLVPVCVLSTTRRESSLGPADRPLAALCDDQVEALATDPIDGFVARTTWREWEIELVDGTEADLDRFGEVVLAAGAEIAGSASKLGTALAPLLQHRSSS